MLYIIKNDIKLLTGMINIIINKKVIL